MGTARTQSVLHLGFVRFLIFVFGALTLFTATTVAAAVEYELRVLDSFTPTDINDNGWVVGYIPSNYSYSTAVLRAGRLRTLVSSGTANAVNNAGVVVGTTSGQRGFRITPAQSEVVEELGLLTNGTTSVATAINENGVAAGSANTQVNGGLVDQAVYFPAGAKEPRSIGHLFSDGGKAAYAYGINDNGDIVGAFIRASDSKYRPFRYTAGGIATLLPGFDDVLEAKALAINNSGRIIGNLTFPDGRQRGFIFENGTRTDIEAPAPDAGKLTYASGLNNSGQVVGGYTCGTTGCPFILDNGTFTNLLSAMPGYSYGHAYAINNLGEIAIFTNNNPTLVLSPKRQAPVVPYSPLPLRAPKTNDAFGAALAFHGNVAVIGAPGENGSTGAAYVYRYGRERS